MSEIFEFAVLTDEEIEAQRKILAEGEYDFQSFSSAAKVSQFSGGPMVEVDIKVWDIDGKEHNLKDWFEGNKDHARKVKSYWESVGRPENYLKGQVPVEEFSNQFGKLKIIHKKSKEGRINPRIAYYIKGEVKTAEPLKSKVNAEDDFDDDILF